MPRAVIVSLFNFFYLSLIRFFSIKVLIVLGFALVSNQLDGQVIDSLDRRSKIRRIHSVSAAGLFTIGSYAILHKVWYEDFEKVNFHFFNDSKEWNGMDKVGHLTTAYSISERSSEFFEKSEWSSKAPYLGASFGFVYTSTLEFLDAYSADWGFSMYDLGSNFIGAGVYLLQEKKFNSQLVRFKWSYSKSGLAETTPNLLGSNSYESLLKDYNAQTYWASVGFMRINSSQERWICASLGYSIDGFIRARTPDIPSDLNPRSQYYLSLDIDWSKIPIKNKHLKNVLKVFNFVKIPFPALQWDKKYGVTFHPLYF
ncbi:MAG: hypothetical protein ACI8QW_001216 [Saprospiraceae bacterium]|jgi:hypothetical protein